MKTLEIIIIAIALAMDAFAVSITCGLSKKSVTIPETLKVALFFGGFQALMPLLGFYTGKNLPFDIQKFDHWIAFILLFIIGLHMIKESFDQCEEESKDFFNTKTLLIAAIATSIDALAAGFSASLLNANIMVMTITAGSITFILSIIGIKVGKLFGHLLEKGVEIVSGCVLIIIGAKILVEHLITS